MKIFNIAKTAILNLAVKAMGLSNPSAVSGAALPPLGMARLHPAVIEKKATRPAGAKLARKAANGLVGIARIR